ncbi:hypothetical protein QZH41_004746 [Actinostola sp. cb2023]|nr:hypothetical protein QZH41_004746 [Actinostola sp. cb2023]
MGAEQSVLRRRQGIHPALADAMLSQAFLEALSDLSSGESGKKGYREGRHVWEIHWEKEERGAFAIVGVATPKAPLNTLGYVPVVGSNTESWGWDIVSRKLWHGGERGVYPAALSIVGFQVPDTFFVILDMDARTLSFAANDVHLGVAFTQLPKQHDRPMCPIVNAIFGNCDIRMRYMGNGGGAAETQSSNDSHKEQGQDTVFIMVQMKNAIDLVRAPINPGLPIIIKKLAEDVLQPYMDNNNQSIRQKYGDHLAEIGAAQQLKNLLERLDDTGIETTEGWIGMSIVRSILWNYSDASLKLGKKIGQCGLLKRFVDDMKRTGPGTIKNEKRKFIVTSAVNILHNCSKASENRQVFRDIKAVDILAPFLQAENSEMVTSTLLTLSYITEDNQKDILETDSKTIAILRGILCNATNSDNLRGTTEGTSWSALEIITGIANIAVNQSNCENLIEVDVIPLLFDILKKGGAIEKESDTALGGKKLSEVDGHFCDEKRPDGFNTKQVFVSPSIRYSQLEVYAKTQTFVHPETKTTYKAKVAFQLWIQPDSYNVGAETVGAKEQIDPKFSNQEIEWSTVQRGAIHLYGVLVRLDESVKNT